MSEIRILVVEDDPIISFDIAKQLRNLDYEVLGQAYDAEAALEILAAKQPDLVLLDIDLGGGKNGIDIAQHLQREGTIPFIFLTSFADRGTLSKAKETQPSGYIVKPFKEQDLLTQIEIALFNHAQRSPATLNLERMNAKLLTPLTQREFELLSLLYEGNSNRKLAEILFVSPNTIKSHIRNLYLKLEVNSRTECMAKVRELMG